MTRAALTSCKYDDDDLRNVFESLIKTNENIAVVQQQVDEYVAQIKKLFVLEKGKPDNSDDLSDYKRTFYDAYPDHPRNLRSMPSAGHA